VQSEQMSGEKISYTAHAIDKSNQLSPTDALFIYLRKL
jgi:hypothetical protein